MIFDRDYTFTIRNCLQYTFFIERLECPQVYDACVDPSFCQIMHCLVDVVEHESVGKDARISTITKCLSFARFDGRMRNHSRSVYCTHVPRVSIKDNLLHTCEHFIPISWTKDAHPGNHTHQRDIFNRLVGGAVGCRKEASHRTNELDRCVGNSYICTDKLKSPHGQERR